MKGKRAFTQINSTTILAQVSLDIFVEIMVILHVLKERIRLHIASECFRDNSIIAQVTDVIVNIHQVFGEILKY